MAAYESGSMELEYRYLDPEKGLRWFYCKGSRIREDSAMVGVLMDITERKKIDEARSRLAAIVESSDDAIFSQDLRGIVTSWNRAAEKIYGYSAEEMLGQSITSVIPLEMQSDEERILAMIARGESTDHFETVHVTKAEERIDVSLTVSPIRDESGNVTGAAKIVRDITQKRKTEQALRTTERLASVGRLAATIAHEINNPLEAVTNLIYLARSSSDLGRAQEFLRSAEEELERVSQLTKQTLGFYRETKGSVPTQIGALLMPLIAVFSSKARNKGIVMKPEIEQDPEIQAIPGEIRQLLANLIGNSIDAMDSGGAIRIRLSSSRLWNNDGTPGVRISVADTGCGIPANIRPLLFEPFFTTKKEVGTGLGLWVCKSIVEKHGGTIRVKSSTAGANRGTVFSILLPLAQPAQQEHEMRHAV